MQNEYLNTTEEKKELPPSVALYQMMTGYWISRAISVAAELRIADLLKDGPMSSEELAHSAGGDGRSLYRLLRALASVGVLTENDDRRFSLTPIGEGLRTGVPGSMCALAKMHGESDRWRVWGNMLHSVKTGETALEHTLGMNAFEYYRDNPQAGVNFNEAMTDLARMKAKIIPAAYDFSCIDKIVDVGGGQGGLLIAILKSNPKMKGILFDLPGAIKSANEILEDETLESRCELIAGDFFESIPAGGDTYLLSSVIHDWHNDQAITILKNCSNVMAEEDKILLIEKVLPHRMEQSEINQAIAISDLNMMVITGGVERTEAEFQALLASAGFNLTKIIPTDSPFSVIEGVRM